MTLLDVPLTTSRLFATVQQPTTGPSLAHHLDVHGPPPHPTQPRGEWGHHFIDLIARSGLTGRGGASFPTASKMASVRRHSGKVVLVVNAMEGEPSSQKDRLLATVAPHLVLEGAELVAAAIGATDIRLCVARSHRAAALGWRDAVSERIKAKVALCPTAVLEPPARYVGGEESALVHWLEGGDIRPTFRPDRPAHLTIGKRETLVQNAETLAHVALIARHGAGWFRSVGTSDAPGTTLVTVSGAVGIPGVYEIPLGTPVSELLHRAALATVPSGILLGGYGGTWLPVSAMETPLAPGALAAQGCSLGAGVVAVLPTGSCGLAETARVCRWLATESAGQCGPCVFGLPAVANDMEALAHRGRNPTTTNRLWDRLGLIEGRGSCRHPDGAARFVRSALRAFEDDVERHLHHGPCEGAERAPTLQLPNETEKLPWR